MNKRLNVTQHNTRPDKKAIVLLSGGLDSATVLAKALAEGYECYALAFDYGQRHRAELVAAERIAQSMGAKAFKVIKLDLSSIGGSALTDMAIDVPDAGGSGIPVTYVPARNTVFLSIALGWAEVVDARSIHIGVNAVDYSGYPDCRPDFVAAFERLANVATKAGIEGHTLHIATPLIDLSKAEIIQLGTSLGVDYALTVSCYKADNDGLACGRCDSCHLRKEGFAQANVADPTAYKETS
ncbi:7-cyano-7-deazaguanine synthase QueC [Spongiibacter sp. KMU-166]|uniref:7-cyano-7-deazaguanine synthase n=1 Tax=Spongiibacter thalassae TaxID=2721624 RepID=A0ABX1GC62_9GAMM|nr:7-cyano-7-deazaguanine synthase QueC [Spongiibacter thalassae]